MELVRSVAVYGAPFAIFLLVAQSIGGGLSVGAVVGSVIGGIVFGLLMILFQRLSRSRQQP